MSCIVLGIELADKKVIKELGVYKHTKQTVWATGNLEGILWNSGRVDYSELPTRHPGDV